MRIRSDANCCSQKVLSNFGGRQMEGSQGDGTYEKSSGFSNYETFVSQVRMCKNGFDAECYSNYQRLENQSFVTATTVSLQEEAEEYLSRFGFKRVHTSTNLKYREVTPVSLWVMDAREFCDVLKGNK